MIFLNPNQSRNFVVKYWLFIVWVSFSVRRAVRLSHAPGEAEISCGTLNSSLNLSHHGFSFCVILNIIDNNFRL